MSDIDRTPDTLVKVYLSASEEWPVWHLGDEIDRMMAENDKDPGILLTEAQVAWVQAADEEWVKMQAFLRQRWENRHEY